MMEPMLRFVLLAALCSLPAHAQVKTVLTKGLLSVYVEQHQSDGNGPTVIVCVHTANKDTESFQITVEYERDGKKLSRTSSVQRSQYTDAVWTSETFWIGDVKLLSVNIVEQKPVRFDMAPIED